jgi:hypothetical protein
MPQKALRGGIRWTFVDVFVNIWRESPTFPKNLTKLTFEYPHEGPCVESEGGGASDPLAAVLAHPMC